MFEVFEYKLNRFQEVNEKITILYATVSYQEPNPSPIPTVEFQANIFKKVEENKKMLHKQTTLARSMHHQPTHIQLT